MIRLPRPRAATSLLAALALTGTLAACGEKQETATTVTAKDKVTLVLDYFPNADHAAIYAAQATGAFERAGLDVTIQAPSDAATPLKVLEAGKADFVITYEPELLLARDEGQKVQGVQALIQTPLTAVISLPGDPVRKATDLTGKTVGTAGLSYQKAYLDTILQDGGVDPDRVKRVDLGFNLNQPLLGHRVQATLGGFWNYEGLQLQRAKKHPVITKIEDLGVPTYNELVIAASEDTVRNRGPIVRRFVQAIGFGAAAVKKDPSAGIDPLVAASKGLDRGLQEASLEATLPSMFPAASHPFGWFDVEAWAGYARWMQEHNLIKNYKVSARAVTNEYLAGEGVGDKTDS